MIIYHHLISSMLYDFNEPCVWIVTYFCLLSSLNSFCILTFAWRW